MCICGWKDSPCLQISSESSFVYYSWYYFTINAVLIKCLKRGEFFSKIEFEMSELGMFCPSVNISMFFWHKFMSASIFEPKTARWSSLLSNRKPS